MDAQEATERMTIAMLEKMSPAERQQVLRIKGDLEKVLRKAGRLGVFAFGVLAVDLQRGKKFHSEQEPKEDKVEKLIRINLAGGGWDAEEIDAMISETRNAGLRLNTLYGTKKSLPPPPDAQPGNDDSQVSPP